MRKEGNYTSVAIVSITLIYFYHSIKLKTKFNQFIFLLKTEEDYRRYSHCTY